MSDFKVDYLKNHIRARLNIMVKTCSAIRTLSGAYISIDGKIVLSLKELRADWDMDRRPLINGSLLQYIDFENTVFMTLSGEDIHLDKLKYDDLKALYFYFEMMIPKPANYDPASDL